MNIKKRDIIEIEESIESNICINQYLYSEENTGSMRDHIFGVIDLDLIYPDTLSLNEEDYIKFERILDHTGITRRKYQIYSGYDVGGFEYWNESEKENNYIAIRILIFDPYLSDKELKQIADDLENFMNLLDDRLMAIGLSLDEY